MKKRSCGAGQGPSGSPRSPSVYDLSLIHIYVYKRQAVHMDKRILVTLTLDTALALGKVSRSPRTVQVMKCHQTVLHLSLIHI